MNLTVKESGLLKDLKGQEQLCIDKYTKYASDAKASELKNLFSDMAQTEREHLKTITDMMNGSFSPAPEKISNGNNFNTGAVSYQSPEDKKNDAFLCSDMLATEKHASSLYDTSVFEFSDPGARKVLNHIQSEEQQHGEQIYAFMNSNNMYS